MGTGEIVVLLFIVALVFGTSQIAQFWDATIVASWRRSWAQVAAGLITGAVFYLGYVLGVDVASARAWRDVGLFDHATGLGLICLAGFVYNASDSDHGTPRRSLSEMLSVLLVAVAFLAAGLLTGVAAARLLGPIAGV
jgi:hypothetical protein